MQTNTDKALSGKKNIRNQIISQLTTSLDFLKESLGEKKFNSKVEEAAKLFSKGLKKEEAPKAAKPKDKIAPAKTKVIENKKKEVNPSVDTTTKVASKTVPQKTTKKSVAAASK